ncbi:Insect cuticle protein [Popillia japonica]|uniref:Insect cuticle protein n=1 Tax=Popillia japonica TaxID=7064 RepID=A0AAW1KIT5_POPJA
MKKVGGDVPKYLEIFHRVYKDDCVSSYHQCRSRGTSNKQTKMKVVLVFAAIVALAIAAPQGADKDAVVVKSSFDNIGTDGFSYEYETSNGIAAQEQGTLKNVGTEQESLSVQGQFKYVGPDGVTYTVTYIADDNGFQPQGAHIPSA